VTIYIGGIHASGDPVVVKTLLGSCIAVCLWDPMRAIGGMNHFMLPRGDAGGDLASRFGVHAMDRLIGAMMRLGADRRRFVAKVFGGAHVLDLAESPNSVPQQNIRFAREFMAAEGFRCVGEDVGGRQPRQVQFHTTTGQAAVRRLAGATAQSRVVRDERRTAAGGGEAWGTVELWA
jgi:chemotaxis receptor (MCP) glutamine deamidase CheD